MRSHARNRRTSILALGMVVTLGVGMAHAVANPPLNRNLPAYFIFAMKTAKLKNIKVLDACNVGVNCAQPSPNASCGQGLFSDVFGADGSQWAADFVDFNKPGCDLWQLFFNNGNIANCTIRKETDQLNPLPILANLDGDANPSCAPGCVPDYDDVKVACGFPQVFPACGGDPIIVQPGVDCIPPVVDTDLGNGKCDLPPNTYNSLIVQNNGQLQLDGGNYTFCSVSIGKNAKVFVDTPAVIHVPSGGGFEINNDSVFGRLCGDLTVLKDGVGDVSFGRRDVIVAKFCAPQAHMQLGHGNDLTGQFVGDEILANEDNIGHCCGNAGECTCIDSFSPTTANVGTLITLKSGCDLTKATAVSLTCGLNTFNAAIITKTATTLTFNVPAGALGACVINVTSTAGVFTTTGTLQVN